MRGPPSDIDRLIARYKAGRMSFEDLKTALATRTYPVPTRLQDKPTDGAERYQHASDGIAEGMTKGTWDDITMARLRGDLTPDEMTQINVAWHANHPEASKT